MYQSFFGFSSKPFQLTPDPEFLFLSGVHKRALTYLRYGISDNAGFILLTGEIGAGKTTIVRTLLKEIPEDVRIARVNNTKISSHQLLAMINEDFGLAKGKDKTQLLSNLTDYLIGNYAEGRRAMIIIDEAQNLTPDLLEELRLLSNVETDKAKLLQIVLIGQPELNETLKRPELEQLRQRIAINAFIGNLQREETECYITHRLRIAGNESGITFQDGVMDVIHGFSKGIPRLINIFCEFMLLAAFAERKRTIDVDLVQDINNDLRYEKAGRSAPASSVPGELPAPEYMKMEKTLSGLRGRIEDLEKKVRSMQQRLDGPFEDPKSISIREAEVARREEELAEKEHALREREELIREKEERLKALNMKPENTIGRKISGFFFNKRLGRDLRKTVKQP